MNNFTDNILITFEDQEFNKKLDDSYNAMAGMAHFGVGTHHSKKREQVVEIIGGVVGKGDEAVAKSTEEFDGVKLTPKQFRIPSEDLKKAHNEIDKTLLASIKKSIANVRKYQEEIFIGKNKTCSNGTGVKYTPIERIGICVPGASAPLPSTVIMTAVPAQVAGVKEIVVVSPPRYNGSIHPVTLAVCHELKINEVYRIGGIQAVAALAHGTTWPDGTPHIELVNKIVGPGNQWVQTAKQIVSGLTGIDSVAGPSEVLIIADDSANPAWVAADMLSQAEHNPGSALLFTTSKKFANNVLCELEKQVKALTRAEETITCLAKYSRIIVFRDMGDLIDWANEFASEHLEIQCGLKSKEIAEKINNAGAIFIGDYSPVATGDYFAGPSHTLPTGRTAKFASPLSCNDFIKATSIIEYNKNMLKKSADDIIRLAEAEGLDAHAKSVKIRFEED